MCDRVHFLSKALCKYWFLVKSHSHNLAILFLKVSPLEFLGENYVVNNVFSELFFAFPLPCLFLLNPFLFLLETEPRALCTLGKHSTIEYIFDPYYLFSKR